MPAGARIKAEAVANLVVDQHELEVGEDLVAGIQVDRLAYDIVDHEPAPDPVRRDDHRDVVWPDAVCKLLAAEPLRIEAVADDVHRLEHDVPSSRVDVVVDAHAQVGKAVDPHVLRQALACHGNFHRIVGRIGGVDPAHVEANRMERHEVAVGVAVLRAVERIEASHDLPGVAETVAVGIPVAGIRADDKFLEVGEAVVVEVVLEPLGTVILLAFIRNARIEALHDLAGGDLGADDDVERIETFEDEVLAGLGLAEIGTRRRPDLGLVPEEVLPAVREAVGVGVFHRRIHAVLLASSARLGSPVLEREVSDGIKPVRGGKHFPRLLLVLAERRLAPGENRLVEALVETADLHPVVESDADRRIAVLGANLVGDAANRHLVVALEERSGVLGIHAGEIVLVWVARGNVDKVSVDVLKAGRRPDQRLAAAPGGYRERVGNAVLVDVAEVVLDLPFLREDRLCDGVEIGAVLGLRGRQRDAGLSGRPCDLGRNGVAEDNVRRGAVLVKRGEDPEVEVAVLAVGGIVDVPVGQRAVAVLVAVDVDADVHAAVEGVVVHRRRIGEPVAEGIRAHVGLLAAVPRKLEVLGRRERGVRDKGVALAEASARVHAVVLLRERRCRRAARGTRRKRLEELGGLDRVEVGEGHRAAVLVLYRHRDDLVALCAAEVRDERAGLRFSDELRLGFGVLAAGERDLDAGAGTVGPELGPVPVDIVLDLPLDRVLRRRAAGDLPRVGVLLSRVGADLGLKVVDEDCSRLGSEIVRVCSRMARRKHVVVHDKRLDPEAVDGGVVRAVHGGNGECLRERRLVEGDEIVVAVRVIRMLRIGKRVEPGLCIRRGEAEARVELQEARVLAGRRHARDLDHDREFAGVLRIPVSDADGELAIVGVVVVEPLDKGHFLSGRLLDRGLVEHSHVDRVGDRAPALHVLVHHLGRDLPLTRGGEGIFEQIVFRIAWHLHRIVVGSAV